MMFKYLGMSTFIHLLVIAPIFLGFAGNGLRHDIWVLIQGRADEQHQKQNEAQQKDGKAAQEDNKEAEKKGDDRRADQADEDVLSPTVFKGALNPFTQLQNRKPGGQGSQKENNDLPPALSRQDQCLVAPIIHFNPPLDDESIASMLLNGDAYVGILVNSRGIVTNGATAKYFEDDEVIRFSNRVWPTDPTSQLIPKLRADLDNKAINEFHFPERVVREAETIFFVRQECDRIVLQQQNRAAAAKTVSVSEVQRTIGKAVFKDKKFVDYVVSRLYLRNGDIISVGAP